MQIAKKSNLKNKLPLFILSLAAVCLACITITIIFFYNSAHSPASKTISSTNSKTETTPSTTANIPTSPAKIDKVTKPVFNKSQYSTTDPASIWIVVNKQHPFSVLDYSPTDLVTIGNATISAKAKADFTAMTAAASAQGINLIVGSSYRSYGTQAGLYNSYVAANGQAVADTFSAKPGYSEHQTGLAIDFTGSSSPNCNYDDCYATTPEGSWLSANANEYGFLLRYTSENQSLTGYKNEPWHYRYIGRELAAELKKQNITSLESFFSISGGISY